MAAGARFAETTHTDPVRIEREADIARLADAPWGALEHSIFTAHQMGGCAMGDDPETSVVSSRLQHHHVENLFVVDGNETRHIDCSQVTLPYGGQLLDDVANRTETAMSQEHCFRACELALTAQAEAVRLDARNDSDGDST